MRRASKRLALRAETVRTLTGMQLTAVNGGVVIVLTRPAGSCTTNADECPFPSLDDCARNVPTRHFNCTLPPPPP